MVAPSQRQCDDTWARGLPALKFHLYFKQDIVRTNGQKGLRKVPHHANKAPALHVTRMGLRPPGEALKCWPLVWEGGRHAVVLPLRLRQACCVPDRKTYFKYLKVSLFKDFVLAGMQAPPRSIPGHSRESSGDVRRFTRVTGAGRGDRQPVHMCTHPHL